MRKLFRFVAFTALVLVALVATVVVAMQFNGALDGITMTIDDEVFHGGPLVALFVGGAVTMSLFVAFAVAIVALASAALLVPLVLAIVFFVVALAVVVGLAPLLVPVLVVVGACVLLARIFRRRRTPDTVRDARVIPAPPHA